MAPRCHGDWKEEREAGSAELINGGEAAARRLLGGRLHVVSLVLNVESAAADAILTVVCSEIRHSSASPMLLIHIRIMEEKHLRRTDSRYTQTSIKCCFWSTSVINVWFRPSIAEGSWLLLNHRVERVVTWWHHAASCLPPGRPQWSFTRPREVRMIVTAAAVEIMTRSWDSLEKLFLLPVLIAPRHRIYFISSGWPNESDHFIFSRMSERTFIISVFSSICASSCERSSHLCTCWSPWWGTF